ncbi:MAG: DNA internalization-related competence protein ComEC/Rec2 [Gammaproteobacteria bacterium]|nr:MAG: DNA internalization-related competence protein ComEC/Rec2 [Gammaproteobacteria bacterium]
MLAHIHRILSHHEQVGVVQALLVGERGNVNQQFRQRMIHTGTMHLMAISGLHIGMIFAWCFFLGRWMWVIRPSLALIIPAQRIGLIAGMSGALGYACMAGLTLPTQRALFMVLVMSLSLFSGYRFSFWLSLSTALLVVLIWDPNAVLSTGFWLSFAAVGLIFAVIKRKSGRGRRHAGSIKRWLDHGLKWGHIQFSLLIGLSPILMYSFGMFSGLSPVANLIAIPWVGLLILPMLLMGTLLIPISDMAASWCMHVGAEQIAFLDQYLGYLMRFDSLTWMTFRPSLWQVGLSLLGLVIIILSGPWRFKVAGIPLFLIAFVPATESIPPGAFRATVLDVGQGLSVLLETGNHVWVYDTGPNYSARLIAAEQALWPAMQRHGRSSIDHLIVSHSDLDHSGGVPWLQDHVRVAEVLSSDADQYRGQFTTVHPCQAGQSWEEDGVYFEMLHPRPEESFQDNNASCVLRVQTGDVAFLLAGDIESEAENFLVERYGQNLLADVMIVPHHGSLTSSSPAFLSAVQPRYAILSSGYRNRFGFPNEKVLQRYRQIGAKILNTARDGAVRIDADPGGANVSVYRTRFPHYWNAAR